MYRPFFLQQDVPRNPPPPGPPMPIPRQLYTFPQPPVMPSPIHQQQSQPPPKPLFHLPFSRLEPKDAALLKANHALRVERHHQERCKQELAQLHRERRAALDAFREKDEGETNLSMALGLMEKENAQWWTPNANPAEIDKLRDDIERVHLSIDEAVRRWKELGERIEEKHVEIAFGASDGD